MKKTALALLAMTLFGYSLSFFTATTGSASEESNWNPEKESIMNKTVIGVYYPWYQTKTIGGSWEHWEWYVGIVHNPETLLPDGRRDIASSRYPFIGPYDSGDLDVIKYHISLAKSMGIECFVVSWYTTRWEKTAYGDACLRKMLDIAPQYNFSISLTYEPYIHFRGWVPHETREEAIEGIKEDLIYALDNYGQREAFLKINNKPVIFLYLASVLTPQEWVQMRHDLESEGFDLFFVGDTLSTDYYTALDILYPWMGEVEYLSQQYSVLRNYCSLHPEKSFCAAVYPGFNDTGVWGWGSGPRVIDRQNGTLYKTLWNSAVDSGAPWILVETFNEWNEGAEIEPSDELGFQYVNITKDYVETYKNISLPSRYSIDLRLNMIYKDYYRGELFTLEGYSRYDAGNPVADEPVNISILGTGNKWTAYTNSTGSFNQVITLPNAVGAYTLKVVTSDGFLVMIKQQTFRIGPYLWTDLNQDGIINIMDISMVAKAYGSKPGEENWNERADLDRNNIVNIIDISMVAKDHGKRG